MGGDWRMTAARRDYIYRLELRIQTDNTETKEVKVEKQILFVHVY
jgi:hypothetical protein